MVTTNNYHFTCTSIFHIKRQILPLSISSAKR